GRGPVGMSVSRKLLCGEGDRGGAVNRTNVLPRRRAEAVGGPSDQIGQAERRLAVAAVGGAIEREQGGVRGDCQDLPGRLHPSAWAPVEAEQADLAENLVLRGGDAGGGGAQRARKQRSRKEWPHGLLPDILRRKPHARIPAGSFMETAANGA